MFKRGKERKTEENTKKMEIYERPKRGVDAERKRVKEKEKEKKITKERKINSQTR